MAAAAVEKAAASLPIGGTKEEVETGRSLRVRAAAPTTGGSEFTSEHAAGWSSSRPRCIQHRADLNPPH